RLEAARHRTAAQVRELDAEIEEDLAYFVEFAVVDQDDGEVGAHAGSFLGSRLRPAGANRPNLRVTEASRPVSGDLAGADRAGPRRPAAGRVRSPRDRARRAPGRPPAPGARPRARPTQSRAPRRHCWRRARRSRGGPIPPPRPACPGTAR